jgi:DNA (cytosine-5)-methyltransferase 1
LKPTVGSLFAGIGGFDLAFEREGYDVAWQVEIDSYCQRVLEKHWPDVPRYDDVRDCGLHNLEPVDVIAGGFPCQDLSVAGKQEGLGGERSALWWQMHRIIGELRPRIGIVENVPNLFNRGIDRVCGSLAEIGYNAEWHVISAADVGAPHLRKRLWLVADADSNDRRHGGGPIAPERKSRVEYRCGGTGLAVENANAKVADADGAGFGERCRAEPMEAQQLSAERRSASSQWQDRYYKNWKTEPELGRVADGVPARVDRLRGLGNAIVPQIAQHIARTLKPQLEAVYA